MLKDAFVVLAAVGVLANGELRTTEIRQAKFTAEKDYVAKVDQPVDFPPFVRRQLLWPLIRL